MAQITPFAVNISEDVIARILGRVRDYVWHEEPDDAEWQYGVPLAVMREVQHYWLNSFDWASVERGLNRFPQFRVPVGGCTVHLIHEQASTARGIPLLLLHGWPGSTLEFMDVIEPLAHPERFNANRPAFDVVAVSLPGYGFSDGPKRPVTPRGVAGMMNSLMTDALGYGSYVAQGGDWGSMIAGWLGYDHPDHCKAVHWTMMGLSPGGDTPGAFDALVAPPHTQEEIEWTQRVQKATQWELGYAAIQATRPQTLSYAMMDSPMGVAAWIIEKFHSWADLRGRSVQEVFTLDRLLANVMVYLVNGRFNTATWMYRSLMTEGNSLPAGRRIEVPVGMMAVAHDIIPPPPRSYVEKVSNIVHWKQADRGGHFLAMEQPGLLIEDIRAFTSQLGDTPSAARKVTGE